MTLTEIANSALTKIGSPAIMSIDDDVKRAKTIKNRIYPVIEIVTRMHSWNCATKRAITAPLSGVTPAFGFDYVHSIPTNCVRVLEINPINQDDYRVEGRSIYTNSTEVSLRYCSDMKDNIDLIDPMMAEAISLYLAWDISFPITQSRSIKDNLWEDFEMILRRAKSIDAKEDPPQELQADLFLEARESSSSGPMRANR